MNKFGIESDHYIWIKKILRVYLPDLKVYVFGSRARGDYKKYSDLDLAIESEQPFVQKTLLEVREQFSESNLPFKIDLVELHKVESSFRATLVEELKEF